MLAEKSESQPIENKIVRTSDTRMASDRIRVLKDLFSVKRENQREVAREREQTGENGSRRCLATRTGRIHQNMRFGNSTFATVHRKRKIKNKRKDVQ